jgi:hypothetical protein
MLSHADEPGDARAGTQTRMVIDASRLEAR